MGRKHPDVSRSSPKPNTANPANGNQKLGTIVHRYCRLIEVKSHFENLEDAVSWNSFQLASKDKLIFIGTIEILLAVKIRTIIFIRLIFL